MTNLFMLIYSEEEDCLDDINATCVFHGVFTTKEAAQAQMKAICETTLASELQDHEEEDFEWVRDQGDYAPVDFSDRRPYRWSRQAVTGCA